MTNPRKPFRINVGFIVHEEVGYSHTFPFEFEHIKLDDFEVSNLNGSVHIGRTPQGLIAQGSFSGDTKLQCVRCLKDFAYPLSWSFAELYAFDKDSVSETGVLLPEDRQIDLALMLREYALLEVPISPLHNEDCKGLCIECGQDLNLEDCGHSQGNNDSPFSMLEKLL
ncbi:MAG TPA: DUF177 domain-containing protein [Anaerolineales bacterium]|nr:DUF177 domain-containing protein [Anaerolineales bacterium]